MKNNIHIHIQTLQQTLQEHNMIFISKVLTA